jgi:DNA-3-methyladenine glycosylase II
LSLESLDVLPDDEVIEVLTSIKGLGRWSAQMILIFRLHRPDVWPIGDLGIVRGLERLHGLKKTPKPARLEKLGDVWRPYRSVAAWYLWAGGSL